MPSERSEVTKSRDLDPQAGRIVPTLRRVRRLSAGLVHHRAPTWSVDGRLLAFLHDEGDDACWVICDRKGRVARVIAGPGTGRASFAPDGSLAYGRAVGATSEIWQSPAWPPSGRPTASSTGRRLLGGDGRLYCDPAFSPDGRYLAYIADDGRPGTARRLWVLDLQTDEHRLLVAALPGPDTPSRLAHPAWSPQGDALYFEAQRPDGDALFFQRLPSPWGGAPPAPQRLTAGGYRCPAPVMTGAVLCERWQDGGDSLLVLIVHGERATPSSPSSTALSDRAPRSIELRIAKQAKLQGGLREPALGHSKRGLWLAFSAPSQRTKDEPARCELFAARLQGLPDRARVPETHPGGARVGSRPAGAETP